MKIRSAWLAPFVALMLPAAVRAADPPAWTKPTAPFHIAGNIYYVGTEGLGSYLIVTPKGMILLDPTLEQNVPLVEANIRALGFKLSDVKILLNSHAHFDHAGGLAAMERDTGAPLEAMAQDVWALEHGKHFGDQNYVGTFPPVKVDRILHDGSLVTLGGVTMRAVLTPGHTSGCTTWLTTTQRLAVIFPCSLRLGGNILVGNKTYPGIVGDYRASFRRMRTMDADIVLPGHPEMADVLGRRGTQRNDRGLMAKMMAEQRTAFDLELKKQQQAATPAPAR